MHPIHDHDPLFLLAVGLAAKRRPAELVEIVAAIDFLQIKVPLEQRFVDSLARLGVVGLLVGDAAGVALTPAGMALFQALPKQEDGEARVYAAKQALVDYVPGAEQAPVVVELAAVSEAIAAHRAAAASRAKNLLVPKPKAAETSKARPGQRQRKPMPARRKR